MKNVIIDGKEFQEVKETTGFPIKIVALQRGFVCIGRLERIGTDCKLHDANIIRIWGTKRGLGELANEGKKVGTILDKCYGVVEFDYLTVTHTIKCKEEIWKDAL